MNNSKQQKNLGECSCSETVLKLLEALTAQNQVIATQNKVMSTQNQQLISIVDQNSQLMNQVQSLIDLIGEEEQEREPKPQFRDD
ncbi:hypothetical protein [Acinetobacter sp.]|uniref:hypothetical protein n=1 Tax=Acinetobacter sp. TaxID=472 RepID=UPI00258CA3CE|nr:hypothetical protein [Acinetobacter sp.]